MTHATVAIPAAPPPPALRRRWSKARAAGLVLLAFWAALGLGIVALLVLGYDAEMTARYLPRVLSGVWVT